MSMGMMSSDDPRVPVVFGSLADISAGDAALVEGEAAVPGGIALARVTPAAAFHATGCSCCGPRGAVGAALGRLFMARARGEIPFFRRVVAVLGDQAALRAALAEDVVAGARFRLE